MDGKILVIYSAYNAEEYVASSLAPFLSHRNFIVVASSRKFGRFPEERNDNTLRVLEHAHTVFPDQLIGIDGSDEPVDREHEAKNAALELAGKSINQNDNIEYIMIVDSDEFYTLSDLNKIVKHIDSSPETITFNVNLKNYINDAEHYLKEPFCPPRIFRVSFTNKWTQPSGKFSLLKFHWDNDVCYMDPNKRQDDGKIPVYSWQQFATDTIPDIWVDHYSWLDNERSKNKIEYQQKHFGQCSYKWEDGSVQFNEEYFKKTGEPYPEIVTV